MMDLLSIIKINGYIAVNSLVGAGIGATISRMVFPSNIAIGASTGSIIGAIAGMTIILSDNNAIAETCTMNIVNTTNNSPQEEPAKILEFHANNTNATKGISDFIPTSNFKNKILHKPTNIINSSSSEISDSTESSTPSSNVLHLQEVTVKAEWIELKKECAKTTKDRVIIDIAPSIQQRIKAQGRLKELKVQLAEVPFMSLKKFLKEKQFYSILNMDKPYTSLQINQATFKEIKKAWKKRSIYFHPDKATGDVETKNKVFLFLEEMLRLMKKLSIARYKMTDDRAIVDAIKHESSGEKRKRLAQEEEQRKILQDKIEKTQNETETLERNIEDYQQVQTKHKVKCTTHF